jgi:2-methylisocitrate lyase-like PEP mutase family enzyme
MHPSNADQTPSRTRDIAQDAERLRAFHVAGQPLLLANVWDPPTARTAEAAGLAAVATASAALAPANGYEDHGKLPAEVAFGALGRIARAVSLPVTADLEDGYGLAAEELVERLLAAGACGLNLEDTDHDAQQLVDPEQQADRIAAIKAAGRARGVDLVLNARIDVLIHGQTIEAGLQRARRYLEAGADCTYPIFLADLSAIGDFAALGPTNILWRPDGPRLHALATAGAARISVGPVFFRLMLKRLETAMRAFHSLDDEGACG